VDTYGSAQFRFRFGSDGGVGMEGWYIDDIEIIGAEPPISAIADNRPLPPVILLGRNRPNPLGGSATLIPFALPEASQVNLRIIDAGGRLVRTLVSEPLPAGWHQVAWDGCNAAARTVGSGVYFYVLDAGGQQQTRRLMVLR
jgi:hypothetical protein